MEFLITVDFFKCLFEREICYQDRFQKLRLLTNWIFYAIYFRNKLPNQNKNSKSIENFKIKLDYFGNNGEKKSLRGHFWEL